MYNFFGHGTFLSHNDHNNSDIHKIKLGFNFADGVKLNLKLKWNCT